MISKHFHNKVGCRKMEEKVAQKKGTRAKAPVPRTELEQRLRQAQLIQLAQARECRSSQQADSKAAAQITL